MKRVFKHQNVQMLGLKSDGYEEIIPLEVVARGSEPQLQVSEN